MSRSSRIAVSVPGCTDTGNIPPPGESTGEPAPLVSVVPTIVLARGMCCLTRVYAWSMYHEVYDRRSSTLVDWVRNLEWVRGASRVVRYEIEAGRDLLAEGFPGLDDDLFEALRIADYLNNASFALSGDLPPEERVRNSLAWVRRSHSVATEWMREIRNRPGAETSPRAEVSAGFAEAGCGQVAPTERTRHARRFATAEFDGTKGRIDYWLGEYPGESGRSMSVDQQCMLCMELRLIFLVALVKEQFHHWMGSKGEKKVVPLQFLRAAFDRHKSALGEGRVEEESLAASIRRRFDVMKEILERADKAPEDGVRLICDPEAWSEMLGRVDEQLAS